MIIGLLAKQLWTFVIIWIRYLLNFWLWTHFMRVYFHRVQICSILLNCSIYESGLNNLKTKKIIRINWSLIWFNLFLIHTKNDIGHLYIVIKNNNQYKKYIYHCKSEIYLLIVSLDHVFWVGSVTWRIMGGACRLSWQCTLWIQWRLLEVGRRRGSLWPVAVLGISCWELWLLWHVVVLGIFHRRSCMV